MADTPETLTPTPKPTPASSTHAQRVIKILRNIIGSQALQIAELQASNEERTAALVAMSAELEELKKRIPAGGNDGNEDRRG